MRGREERLTLLHVVIRCGQAPLPAFGLRRTSVGLGPCFIRLLLKIYGGARGAAAAVAAGLNDLWWNKAARRGLGGGLRS